MRQAISNWWHDVDPQWTTDCVWDPEQLDEPPKWANSTCEDWKYDANHTAKKGCYEGGRSCCPPDNGGCEPGCEGERSDSDRVQEFLARFSCDPERPKQGLSGLNGTPLPEMPPARSKLSIGFVRKLWTSRGTSGGRGQFWVLPLPLKHSSTTSSPSLRLKACMHAVAMLQVA